MAAGRRRKSGDGCAGASRPGSGGRGAGEAESPGRCNLPGGREPPASDPCSGHHYQSRPRVARVDYLTRMARTPAPDTAAASPLRGATRPAPTLLDLTPDAARARIESWVAERGLPRYRTEQIVPRLWQRPVAAWEEATDLPRALRRELDDAFPLPRLELEVAQQSSDGTAKFLWRLADGEAIESVLIPQGKRRTLCISSQAGCALGCVFCATGTMGFRRNLSAGEIAGQVREVARRALAPVEGTPPAEAARPARVASLTNVVFMGMGEPLLNWPAVDAALTILNRPEGLGIGARHITVSTVGIIPGMRHLARRPEQFRLAVSLHAADSGRRHALMPIQRKYPLAEVLEVAREFRQRVTFEYVLIAGANDSDADADALASQARALGALVNLLPLHPGGDPALSPTPVGGMRRFAQRLRNQGVDAVVRRSRGLDIDAACGQLSAKRGERGAASG